MVAAQHEEIYALREQVRRYRTGIAPAPRLRTKGGTADGSKRSLAASIEVERQVCPCASRLAPPL